MMKTLPDQEWTAKTQTPAVPTLPPQLSRGKHQDPSRGACFIEYTPLLAGELFSDVPRCVDRGLGGILRGADDTLSDAELPALVPLLGRAIGLVIEPPDQGRSRRWRRPSRGADHDLPATAQLHAMVARKFHAGVRASTSRGSSRWYGHYAGIGETFWDLTSEPMSRRSGNYAARPVQSLEFLHRCSEDSLAELRLRAEARGVAVAPPQVAAQRSSAASPR